MRIYQLEGFYYVGKTGGYAAAARAIPYPVGQPALHQQVRKLQDDLDVPLVRRDGKRIHLTPEGRLLHEFIAPFFEGLSVLDRRLRAGRGGTVVLAATDIFSDQVLPARLRKVRAKYPDVTVSVREFDSIQAVLDAVEAGDADFGMSHFPRLPPRFHHASAGSLDVMACVPEKGALAGARKLTLAEVSKHPLVVYERGSFARSVMDATFEKHQLKPAIAIEASTSSLQLRYVREGLGIALVPRAAGASPEPGLAFIPMPGAFDSYPFHIVWVGGSFPSPLLTGLRDLLAK